MTDVQDYDNPWKEAVQTYLRPFLAICFPKLEKQIDWRQPPEFLNKELLKETRQSRPAPAAPM